MSPLTESQIKNRQLLKAAFEPRRSNPSTPWTVRDKRELSVLQDAHRARRKGIALAIQAVAFVWGLVVLYLFLT